MKISEEKIMRKSCAWDSLVIFEVKVICVVPLHEKFVIFFISLIDISWSFFISALGLKIEWWDMRGRYIDICEHGWHSKNKFESLVVKWGTWIMKNLWEKKRVHFFTLINLEDFMKNLNKTQMIRHRILRDLLGAGLVLDLMPSDLWHFFILGPMPMNKPFTSSLAIMLFFHHFLRLIHTHPSCKKFSLFFFFFPL